jgi:ferredoxin-NADP reductase
MIRSVISHIEYSPSKEVTFVRCKPETLFTFKEGQFMMVASDHTHEGLGKALKKPYSIATSNQELQEQGSIGFVVKKVREGFMSEYLTDTIQVGDIVHLQ